MNRQTDLAGLPVAQAGEGWSSFSRSSETFCRVLLPLCRHPRLSAEPGIFFMQMRTFYSSVVRFAPSGPLPVVGICQSF